MIRLERPKNAVEIKARKKLLQDYLQAKHASQLVTAIEAGLMMSRHWGLLVDWHEFSEVLLEMEATGKAIHRGSSRERMTKYYIPTKDELKTKVF